GETGSRQVAGPGRGRGALRRGGDRRRSGRDRRCRAGLARGVARATGRRQRSRQEVLCGLKRPIPCINLQLDEAELETVQLVKAFKNGSHRVQDIAAPANRVEGHVGWRPAIAGAGNANNANRLSPIGGSRRPGIAAWRKLRPLSVDNELRRGGVHLRRSTMLNYPIVNNHDNLTKVVDLILSEAGLDRKDQGGTLTFAGMDPIRPTHIKVGCVSAAVTAANAIASAILWRKRTGQGQNIHVDLRKAYVTQSAWQDTLADCTLINGTPQMFGGNVGQLGSNILPTRDGRWVILTSLYASNTARICALLDSGVLPQQLERATRKWDSQELERAAQDAGVPLVVCRTRAEYHDTEQYQQHMATPLIHIEKIGDSAPEELPSGPRPCRSRAGDDAPIGRPGRRLPQPEHPGLD